MTVQSVGQTASGRLVSLGRFTLGVGRMPWTRETRVHAGDGFADVTVLGRYICFSWRR